MNHRKEPIHQIRNFPEVWRKMITHVNRIFAVTTPELSYVGYRYMVQRPERVFIEGLDPLFQTDLNTVGQQILLAQKILLLHSREQRRIVLLAN